MPVYEYLCPVCEKRFDAFKKMAQYKEPQLHTCGVEGIRVLSLPMVAVDYPAYISPATGKLVEGKKAHIEDLKRSGCRLFEPGERRDAERRAKAEEVKMDNFVETSVEKVYAELKG